MFSFCGSRLAPKARKVENREKSLKQRTRNKNGSLQANIRDTPFNQRTLGHQELGVLSCHKYTDRQTNRLTSRLYDCIRLGADSVTNRLSFGHCPKGGGSSEIQKF